MRFRQYGKTYQLEVRAAEDLLHVLELDKALWAATSAPVSAFRCDSRVTAFLDSAKTGRIHTEDVRRAVRWLLLVLKDTSRLVDGVDTVPLAFIHEDSPQGRAVLQSARYVLKTLGVADEDISLSQVRSFQKDAASQPLNGDGVVVPEAAPDDATAGYIRDAIAAVGGCSDAGGASGIDSEKAAAFQKAVEAFLAWKDLGAVDGDGRSEVMPLGAATPDVYAVYRDLKAPVEFFFAMADGLSFAPLSGLKAGGGAAAEDNGKVRQAGEVEALLRDAPIAEPSGNPELPLSGPRVNPFYRAGLQRLRNEVAAPILGETPEVLSRDAWDRIRTTLQPYAAYLDRKAGAAVEGIPVDRLRVYARGEEAGKLQELLRMDRDIASILKGVEDVERLLVFHEHLFRLLNNFVCFRQLYSVEERALFEMGSVVIDGRWFNLALPVDDVAAHQLLAKTSSIFTMYLEVDGLSGAAPFRVAVPATSGSKGNLCVGKRGVFFDVQGREYDARITHIIENPISLVEALATPFVRLWQFILGKIEAISGASEKELQKSADRLMTQTPGAQTAPAAQPVVGPAGMLVGLSVSAAAIGSAFAFITKTLSGVTHMQKLVGLLGAAAVVGLPVALIAVLKLRRQDLSSLLEGSGWAVNSRMRFNRALRRQFTRRGHYPESAAGTPRRAFRRRLLLWAVLLLLCAGVWAAATALGRYG